MDRRSPHVAFSHKSRAAADASLKAFREDPEWLAAQTASVPLDVYGFTSKSIAWVAVRRFESARVSVTDTWRT